MTMKKPTTKAGKTKKVSKVMKEWKAGTLHSGKKGPVVKSKKQAVAIALSEAGMSKKKGK
jgi:ribosomal protein L21E